MALVNIKKVIYKGGKINKKIVLIIVSIIVFLLIVGFFFVKQKNNSSKIPETNQSFQQTQNDDSPSIKNIGVNIDYYNADTKKAGDFLFTDKKQEYNRIFIDYGFMIPSSSASSEKINPQPIFLVPMATKVMSMMDGVVVKVEKIYSNDYTILVAKETNSQWMVETEHVNNPKVKEGDKVIAGQAIAEASDFWFQNSGLGIVEIGVLKVGNPPEHYCPFNYLDQSVQNDIFNKINALYKEWENFAKDDQLYNENYSIPGCLSTNPIKE